MRLTKQHSFQKVVVATLLSSRASNEYGSDVNKDLTLKAKDKDKDQTLKAKDQDKDQTYKDKDKDQDKD